VLQIDVAVSAMICSAFACTSKSSAQAVVQKYRTAPKLKVPILIIAFAIIYALPNRPVFAPAFAKAGLDLQTTASFFQRFASARRVRA
jgi:hypothetical protein